VKGGRTASFYLEKSQGINSAVQAQKGWREKCNLTKYNKIPIQKHLTEKLHKGESDGIGGVREGRGDI